MKLSNVQILILRLVLAALFLHLGISKIYEGWLQSPEKLLGSLNNFHQKATGMQLAYLDNVAIPHADLWAKLMAIGETTIGVSLLLGLLVPLSSAMGILMVFNFHAANGTLYSLNFFGSSWAALIIASFFILFLAKAGRWNGIDQILGKKKERSFLW